MARQKKLKIEDAKSGDYVRINEGPNWGYFGVLQENVYAYEDRPDFEFTVLRENGDDDVLMKATRGQLDLVRQENV